MKTAMEATGWTTDALAAHFEIDRSYVSRLLDGEKPFTADRIVDLPDDLEAKFEGLRAERLGLLVVQPLSGTDAIKALVSGLMGVMCASQLPARAGAPLKADLHPRAKAVNE